LQAIRFCPEFSTSLELESNPASESYFIAEALDFIRVCGRLPFAKNRPLGYNNTYFFSAHESPVAPSFEAQILRGRSSLQDSVTRTDQRA
jgi:hypothetical protein